MLALLISMVFMLRIQDQLVMTVKKKIPGLAPNAPVSLYSTWQLIFYASLPFMGKIHLYCLHLVKSKLTT
jgi:hypothetical protein